RRRTLPDGRVWKLGDIIYSTPLVVGPPTERYDLIYGDVSYNEFYRAYKNRRTVVYVGANDGMFHAFNSGRLTETGNDLSPLQIDPAGYSIGDEIFAYIPFNLLPHLKWLPRNDYCHVYYVDLKPYPTDVRIFTPGPIHTNGWGTVIVGGLRLGGTLYNTPTKVYSSAFFLADVTKPENITILWEKRLPDGSYTTSFPTTCKVGGSWFLVVGTGPNNLSNVNSNQAPKIYVLDYRTGQILRTFNLPVNSSFVGDIISVDYDLDYNVEVLYFGTNILENPTLPRYGGVLYKIKTNDDPNPNSWALVPVFDAGEPIISSPSVGMDSRGRLWVYFGTGRFYTREDANYLETQYLVGVRDEDAYYNLNNLLDVTNIRVFGPDSVFIGQVRISFNELERRISTEYKGWYRRLVDGERCITNSALIGGIVLFTTFKPKFEPCEAGGTGALYALYYLTGTAYYKPIVGELATGENLPSISTGPGAPSEPTVYVSTEGEKVFVQLGTGGIFETESPLPFSPQRSRVIFWKGR
ncbi:MAG: PilC/PilY family type IV pilus protein, partial [Candidatus Hydrothermales bacterium]